MLHYNPLHVSSINMPIFRMTNCIITATVIVTLCTVQYSTVQYSTPFTVQYSFPDESRRHNVQPFTESDDNRCCDNKTCHPEDGHVDARNMSRIIILHTYC